MSQNESTVFDFTSQLLICDGAMGTMLIEAGADLSQGSAALNLFDPETVVRVHSLYHNAGSQCAITNSFEPCVSEDEAIQQQAACMVSASVELARKGGCPIVMGDCGPCSLVLEPLGQATFEQAYDAYIRHITALLNGSPDAILLETFIDVSDMRCALLAAKTLTNLPIIVTCTFSENGRMPLSFTTPETVAVIAESLGANIVGVNCGVGPKEALAVITKMSQATSLPLIVQPNAGLPQTDAQGNITYPGTPEQMASQVPSFVLAGATIVGSCCGSTPDFTRAIAQEASKLQPMQRVIPQKTRLASMQTVLEPNLQGVIDCASGIVFDCCDGEFDKWEILENTAACPFMVLFEARDAGYARLEQTLQLYPGRAVVVLSEDDSRACNLAGWYGSAVVINTGNLSLSQISQIAQTALESGIEPYDILIAEGSQVCSQTQLSNIVLRVWNS